MSHRRPALALLLLAVLALPSCSSKPERVLADDAKRKEMIEALASNPSSRQEVVDRLVGSPATRTSVIDRILKDEGAAGELVKKILGDDRGKALVASKVAEDASAKTFVRMLMLTGVMGDSLSQKQAEAMGLGEPFALGNQRRTMSDLKHLGALVDGWAKQKGGRYPVCSEFGEVASCLVRQMGLKQADGLPTRDAWGHPYQYRTDKEGTLYVFVSLASDGKDDGLGKVGPTDSYDCDIVFSNGDFIQWPGWIHKSDIR